MLAVQKWRRHCTRTSPRCSVTCSSQTADKKGIVRNLKTLSTPMRCPRSQKLSHPTSQHRTAQYSAASAHTEESWGCASVVGLPHRAPPERKKLPQPLMR